MSIITIATHQRVATIKGSAGGEEMLFEELLLALRAKTALLFAVGPHGPNRILAKGMPGCRVFVQLETRLDGLWLPAASADWISSLHAPGLQDTLQ